MRRVVHFYTAVRCFSLEGSSAYSRVEKKRKEKKKKKKKKRLVGDYRNVIVIASCISLLMDDLSVQRSRLDRSCSEKASLVTLKNVQAYSLDEATHTRGRITRSIEQ